MRAIEAEINRRRNQADRRTEIPLTNFRGIELRDFPAEIARLALIIAEFQCDPALSRAKGSSGCFFAARYSERDHWRQRPAAGLASGSRCWQSWRLSRNQ
jgi:hypothetical protein